MSAVHLAHPEWLVPLGLALAATALCVGAARWVAARRRSRLLGRSGGRVVHPALRSDAALLVAAAAIAVALVGPRIGERVLRVPANGVDVVFLLDVSASMDARDVPPSRLDRARRAVRELLSRIEPRDRAAIAAFAGSGVLLTPLTPDRDVLGELLSGLSTTLVRPASSDLGAGVQAGLQAFEPGSERPRVLVVLSDGEDPQRRGDLGAAAAARAGVRVLAAGFGSEVGATISDHGVPLTDASGRPVVTRRDLGRLGALAEATGGVLFAADAWGEVDLRALTSAIRRDAGSAPGALVERRVRAVQVVPFAALAFALLLLEGLPRRIRGDAARAVRARRRRLGVAAAGAIVLAAAPSGGGDDAPGRRSGDEGDAIPTTEAELEARVRARPDDAAGLVALGAARLSRGRRDAAARAFLAAAMRARDPHAAAIAYFDLGVAHLERQDLEAARDAFLDALALDPRDARARFNLEWTLLALRQQPPQSPDARAPEPDAEDDAPSEPEAEPPVPELPEAAAPQPSEPPPESEPPPLDEAARERLLERVEDDPAHALRSAASEARDGAPGGVAVW